MILSSPGRISYHTLFLLMATTALVLVGGSGFQLGPTRAPSAASASPDLSRMAKIPTVGSSLQAAAPNATPSTLDEGLSLNLTVQASGGSPPYTYNWLGLPSGCFQANSSRISCHPDIPGNYSISVLLNDSGGNHTVSPNSTLVVNPPLWGSMSWGPSAGPAPLTVGFWSSAENGTPPYSYWIGFGDGTSGSGMQVNHTYTVPGKYPASLWVNDSDGEGFPGFANITVVGKALTLSNVTPSPSTIELGHSVTFNVTAAGGTGVYTYGWYGLPGGCAPVNASIIRCVPNASGSYSVLAAVTDSAYESATDDPVPFVVSSISASISANRLTLDSGQTLILNAAVTGGSGTYSYVWGGLPQGCSTSNISSLVCAPNAPGTYTVGVQVMDSNGGIGTSNNLTIVVSPSLTFILSPGAATVDVGAAVVFHAISLTGGGGYGFKWGGLPPDCASADQITQSCTPTAPGNYSVWLNVSDRNGAWVNASGVTGAKLTVNPRMVLSLSAPAGDVAPGSNFDVTVTIAGGTGPFTLSYQSSPTPDVQCNLGTSPIRCQATDQGDYTITFFALDSEGGSANSSTIIHVRSPGAFNLMVVLVAVGAAAVVGAVAGYFVIRRRRGSQSGRMPPVS